MVHNVTRSAGVFFIKTLYSILLCVLCLLTNTPFPFVPIQITLIDLVIEGYPSFFLSFLPDSQPVRTKFLPEAIRRAAPNALAIGVCFLFYLVLHAMGIFGLSGEQTQANTLLFLLIGTVGLLGVFKMCLPFTKVKVFFAATSAIGFYFAIAPASVASRHFAPCCSDWHNLVIFWIVCHRGNSNSIHSFPNTLQTEALTIKETRAIIKYRGGGRN